MRKVFRNSGNLTCIFSDEGISIYGDRKEAFYPYGCMDSVFMNLMGYLQINYGFSLVTFLPEKQDRAALRAAVREAKARIRGAEREEPRVYSKCSKVSDDLPPEEQLRQFKHLLATGTISKGYYDLKKRLLLEE